MLINRKAVKELILKSARKYDVRQNKFTQVNGDTIDQIERNIGLYIEAQCRHLPRIGKTVKFDTPVPADHQAEQEIRKVISVSKY